METRHPQHDMREKCFHPSGSFSEFFKEEVEQSIPIRFQKIVRKYADRIAVKTESNVLTYAELNAMANRVARAILAREGDKAGSIGLLLENGAELVAAMLGVLKAGKFFTLLDPAFPKARIVSILEDSESRLVIASRQVASSAKEIESNDCRFLEFESAHSRISDAELQLHASPETFACIVYTSGSTGQPKGIVWAHRDLLHRIMLRTNENHPCEHDRVALLPAGTANAVTNIFLALLNGATLLPFDVQKEGVTRLANWLLQERVSICPISSPLFRNLCETLTGEERFPDLRVIRLRSEAVYKTDVDLYKKYFPPTCIFLTGLATSETGQLTTCLINHDTEITGDEMPVGYAVEDKEISLLDETGIRVGFNEVGEIAVRSRYLSPGYWRKPDLNRAKFKPDPEDGAMRLCFTGDLGLMLPDGCLIHKGRKDFRVKVRGYGVEFAEVEKALLEHEGIREAVVVARQSQSGEARLVAYYIPFRDPGPNVSELRGFLKKKLPDYMIPSALVMVDAIPLTSNGKIDRKSLPDPKTSRPEIDTPFVSPRTSKEEELVKIWAELLDLDQIGIHDNFFDLGGHSLLASQVLSRIHDAFQIELPLSQFFETPTVADLTGYIEKTCAPQKRAETFSVQSTSRDGRFLLSFAQQRLWFLDQLEPGSAAYNLVSAARLKGRLNLTALEQSFNEIIRRHEALRTVFKAVDGEPVQVILPSVTIKLPIIDLSGMVSDTEREGEIGRLSTAEAQRPFDLARGPLLRATILRLRENEQVLLWVRHHIVFDGWSNGILARELSTLYEAFSSGRPSPLPVLPIQYADYARWERQRLQGRLLQAPLAYWKKKLADVPALQLPRDRPRPPVRTHCGARRHFVLSEQLSAELKNLSNRQSVTLFVTLLAAYQTLLYRTTGQNDIVTGSPIAGRNRTELETLIGFFLNMLVLRVDLSGNPTFRQLLARVRETCLEAYAHQDVPFEKLVEELQPQRDLSRNPLFQTTFAFQNTPKFPLNLAGLAVNDLEVCSGIVRFDLHLFMEEGEHGLRGYVDYNTDLFNAATITRMLGHFQTLLESIAARPDERIGSLPLLTEAELAQLLFQWNATRRDYPKDSCIHELFEAQAEKSPDAVALVFDGKELTYRELNRRANQLARHLKKHYVGPETLVGVCMERSLEMVISLLGILKAGGAYVPLDPAYPKERLAFMLQDAHGPVLLTQAKFIEQQPEHTAEAICLDTGWDAIALEGVENPTSGAKPENLAYVIYTSGSTGQPKGAMNTHLGICNRLLWMQEAYRLNETDRVLQKTPFSFDVSVWEFFWPLLTGAQLVVARPGGHQDSTYLVELIAERKVTTLHFVPSMLQIFLEQPGLQACNCLRRVICSGEALPTKLEERFFSRLGAELHNLYGPTEAAVDVTYWACRAGSDLETVPIGRPIANTQIYLLDPQLQPVPIGVPGELHIGGVGVARGYLNRPELSAEKFIPNPFSDEPGARLYRTGDLVRYLADGNIDYLGRIDNQVKLRGFRIELGEIETVLAQHPTVRQAVITAGEDSPGAKRLVAYVVATEEKEGTVAALRTFLKEKLPDYMVPAAFVFLESLPLTDNGKLDRRALPAPDADRPGLDSAFIEARTAVEKVLAAIWCEVLGLACVGVQDNFFDLGGHSLRATQAVFRMRDALNVELSLTTFFQAPTIAELATALMQAPGERLRIEETAQLLLEVARLSEDEAQKMLDEKLR